MIEAGATSTDPYLLNSWTNTAAVATSPDGTETDALPIDIPTNTCGTTSP
jgi:hypothetical protein